LQIAAGRELVAHNCWRQKKQMSITSYLFRKIAARRQREIDHILNNPVEVMDEKLKSILKHHQDTVLGRRFGHTPWMARMIYA